MAERDRRGMLIQNNGSEEVNIAMASRTLQLRPGEKKFITPSEVRDQTLRTALQERSISIVRPATEAEEEALQERLDEE
jgi:DNA-directed RNA polymerase subunit K/omega